MIRPTSGQQSAFIPPTRPLTSNHLPDAALASVAAAAFCIPFPGAHTFCFFELFALLAVPLLRHLSFFLLWPALCAPGEEECFWLRADLSHMIFVLQISTRSTRDWMFCIASGNVQTMRTKKPLYKSHR